MAWKNDLLITTLLISILTIGCNNHDTVKNAEKDSLEITAGTGINRTENISTYLSQTNLCSTFFKLLQNAGLTETLNKPGPFTIFAPTNNAFQKLSAGQVEKWKTENTQELLSVLSGHIVAGSLQMSDLQRSQKLKALSGGEVTVKFENNKVTVGGKSVLTGNIVCTNGVIYMIDEIILPPKVSNSHAR